MIIPSEDVQSDRILVPTSNQWEIAFFSGHPNAEGFLAGEEWQLKLADMLDTELFSAVKEKLPIASRVFEMNTAGTFDRLRRVGDSASLFTGAGKALINVGNYTRANELLRQAVELEDTFVPAQLALAESLMRVGQLEEAHEIALRFIENRVYGDSATIVAADASFRVGNTNVALELLAEGQERWRTNGLLPLNAGIVYLSQGQTREAARKFRESLQRDARLTEAYHGLALCYIQQKMYRKAVRQFKLGLSIGGLSSRAIRNLCRTYQQLGQHPEVIETLSRYVDRFKNDLTAHFILAYSFHREGKYAEARRHLEFILESMDGHSSFTADPHDEIQYDGVLNNIAATYAGENELERAKSYYERALASSGPANRTIRHNLISLHTAINQLEEAELLTEETANIYGVDDEIRFLHAINLYCREHFSESTSELESLVASNTKIPYVYVWLSYLRSEWELNFSGALEIAISGSKRFNQDARLLNSVAYHNVLVGNLDVAQAIMERKAWPASRSEAIATKGLWYFVSGDFHAGVTCYNNAQHNAPPDFQLVIEQKKRLEMGKFYLRAEQPLQAARELRRVIAIDSLEKLAKLQAEELLEELTRAELI